MTAETQAKSNVTNSIDANNDVNDDANIDDNKSNKSKLKFSDAHCHGLQVCVLYSHNNKHKKQQLLLCVYMKYNSPRSGMIKKIYFQLQAEEVKPGLIFMN